MNSGNPSAQLTAGRDPGARAPAPGSLRLVQVLVNTVSVEFERDLLSPAAGAARWLMAAGLLPPGTELTSAQRQALVELREALRGVLRAHTNGLEDPDAASRLSVSLAQCRLSVEIDATGCALLSRADSDPFARIIGAFAVAIAEAAGAGTWMRLKSCPGHLCGWAFYDRSASAQSRWCSMQLCGTRSKMRSYRTRRATAS